MKRTQIILFTLLFLAISSAAQAQLTYSTNNGTITITGYFGSGGPVTIPNGDSIFDRNAGSPFIYYIDGRTGWGPAYDGIPTAPSQQCGGAKTTFNYTITTESLPFAGGLVSGTGTFASGRSQTVTAKANSGYMFSNWTENGRVVSSSASYTFTLNGNQNLVANFVKGDPKLTITSPKSGQSVSNALLLVTGTVTDKLAVDGVFYQLNGSDWAPAMPSNSWSNWTASVNLSKQRPRARNGANTISAYVQDAGGCFSTNTVVFTYIPSATLTVYTNGLGGITPVDNRKLLAIGTNYTLTASPGKNWIFSNWVASGSADFISNNAVLTFKMQSNLTLTANFVTNPFIALQGSYNGLFYQTNSGIPVTEQSSGFATITIASGSKGTYSAVLKVDGGSYPFCGALDLNGNCITNITRKGKSSLALTLHMDLNLNSPADYMTGSVEASDWAGSSALIADLAYFNGTSLKASNYAGKYTLALPGTDTPATSPGGYSVAEITNSLAGSAVLTGTLADNTTISAVSTPISKEGFVPIYYSYTPGTNVIFGWLKFTNIPPQTVPGDQAWIELDQGAGGRPGEGKQTVMGDLTWFKLPTKSKGLYSGGFTNQTNIIGSAYAPLTTNILVNNATLTIVDPGQGISLVYSNVSIISNKLSYATPPTNQLTAAVTSITGAISLTFRPTGAKACITAQGVLLQNSPADPSLCGAGWFAGTNQTGYFQMNLTRQP